MSEQPPPDPTVRPLGWAALAVAALVGVVLGLGLRLGYQVTGFAPVPYGTAFLILGLAVVVALFARTARRRIQRDRERVEPRVATWWLGLGRGAAVVGAALTAGFAAFALAFADRWSTALGQARVVHGGLAALAGVGLGVAGLALERACRVPPDDDER